MTSVVASADRYSVWVVGKDANIMNEKTIEICPNCDCNRITKLEMTSTDGWTGFIHRKSGKVTPLVCMTCGTLFLGEYDLKKINKSEKE